VLGFLTRKSTSGTRGTVVGRPEVGRTLDPEELGLALDEGAEGDGAKADIAEFGDLTAEAGGAAVGL